MSEFADLGLRIHSEDADAANKRLDTFEKKAAAAEKASDRLGAGSQRAGGAIAKMLASIEKSVRAMEEIARLQAAAGVSTNSFAQSQERAAAAVDKAYGVNTRYTASFAPMRAQMAGAAADTARLAAATTRSGDAAQGAAMDFARLYDIHKNGNFVDDYVAGMRRVDTTQAAAAKSSRQLTLAGLDLSRQFADIGVTAAMGMNPLMILIQQGPQIADRLAMMKMEGIGLAAALRSMGAAAAPIAVALAPVALAVGAAVTAFGLFERAIDKNTKYATTWGDTWNATVKVVGAAIMKGPIGDALRWLEKRWGEVLDFMTKAAFEGFTSIAAIATATYKTIEANWNNLPGLIEAAFVGGVNRAIDALQNLANAQDGVMKGLRDFLGFLVPTLKPALDAVKQVDLSRFKLKAGSAGQGVMADFDKFYRQDLAAYQKAARDFGTEIAKQADKEYLARQKQKKSAKERADALSEEERALQRAIQQTADFIAGLEREIQEIGLTDAQLRRLNADREIEAALKRGDVDSGLRIRELAMEREALISMAAALKEVLDLRNEFLAANKNPVIFETDPAKLAKDMKDVVPVMRNVRNEAEKLSDAFDEVAYSLDGIVGAFRHGDFRSLSRDILGLVDGIKSAYATGGIGGAAGAVASAAAPFFGGRTGRTLSGVAAGAQLGGLVGGPIGAGVGAVVGGLAGFLVPKASNAGAGYDLTTGAITGKSRTSETESAVTAAAKAIQAGQDLLKGAGATLTDTVRGLVIGSRDLSQIYTASGRTITSAVGDVQAAAEAGLRAVLEGAKFADAAQQKLVDSMLAAGKGFDDITAALQTYAAAQKISGGIADEILRLRDPKAFDIQGVTRDIQAQRDAAAKLAADGHLTAETLATINGQLTELEGLRLNEVLKRYADSVEDATAANDNALQIAAQRRGLEIEIMRAFGDEAGAMAAERADILAALDPSLRGLQQTLWGLTDAADAAAAKASALEAALQAANDTTDAARQTLREAYERDAQALRSHIDEMEAAARALGDFRRELDFGDIAGRDPVSQYMATKREFDRLNALSANDPERLANLDRIGQAFLEASRAASPTQLAFDRDLSAVRRAVEASEKAARTEADIATRQLDALTAQVGQLIDLNTGVKTVAAAILSLREAMVMQAVAQQAVKGPAANDNFNAAAYLAANKDLGRYAAANGLDPLAFAAQHYRGTGQYEIAAGLRTPGFAAGGWHSGGVRLVGEQGPEIEATGPARYYSAQDTRRMLSEDDGEAVAELRALRAEVAALRAAAEKTAQNTTAMEQRDARREFQGFYVRGEEPGDPVSTEVAA